MIISIFSSLRRASKNTLKNVKGFTLIELLVVIVIIGILAAGATTVFSGAQAKARDSQRITGIQAIKGALEQYSADEGSYPIVTTVADFKDELSSFINKWPQDPKNIGGYQYVYCSASINGIPGQAYALAVRVESEKSAKGSDLAVITSEDTEDARSTYVTGPDPSLIGTAATATSVATCDNGADDYTAVVGGVIAN